MIESHAVLEVSDGILDLGVAAMVGLQLQGIPVPVGDEAVIAVAGEEGQLGTGRGLHPPDDEPHRRGIGLAPEGNVSGLGHIGGAVHPVGDGSPVRLGYGFNEIAQAGTLADGDGEADLRLATDGDDGVGIEAAVGPHRELPLGPSMAHPSHALPQEGPQGGSRLDCAADGASCPAGTQYVGVVNAVAPSQRGGHQGQHLVSRVRPPRRISEVNVAVDEFPQTQVLGEGHRKEQPSIGHQPVVLEGDLNAVGIVLWQHLSGAPCFQTVFCSKTIIPDSQEHLFALSRGLSHALVRWIGAKQ